ncbi:MAG: hypothetical protein QNI93_18100 [Kiloniellales bacterium]|nr:hypothetical protein [Kiloniellales bacterium]
MSEQPEDLGEVIYEFIPMGRYVKVAAVDPATLTEVSIVGDPAVGETLLKRQARRKLAYVLAKKAEN